MGVRATDLLYVCVLTNRERELGIDGIVHEAIVHNACQEYGLPGHLDEKVVTLEHRVVTCGVFSPHVCPERLSLTLHLGVGASRAYTWVDGLLGEGGCGGV